MVEGEISRLLTAAMAPNTLRAYQVGWRAFCNFKQQHSTVGNFSPASAQDIREFVASLSLQHLAPSTIATYVSGVGYFHKVYGWPDPTRGFLVAKLLEGCRRDHRGAVDTRLPITLPLLSRLLQALPHVCTSTFEASLFRAVFLSAFFGFMRIGEFAATSGSCLQNSLIMFSDVRFCDVGTSAASVLVTFRCSKANQSGPPQHIRLVRFADESLCPIQALLAFKAVRPLSQGSFFCHFDGRPLTKFQFNAVLRKVLRFSGLDELRVRAHSFRIGAATTAAAVGVRVSDIQSMGRWRSDAVHRYIRTATICQFPLE